MSASTKIHNSEAETKIKTKNHSLHQTKMPKKYEDHIETISNKW